MTIDYGLWNAIVSTVTLLVVAATAFAALRQIRQLRAQNTLTGMLKILDDWRDPAFRALHHYSRIKLPDKMRDPAYLDELDSSPIDRTKHPELDLCDWYEQVGTYLKHGLLDEELFMDIGAAACNGAWQALEPVVLRMRSTRGDTLYENFEYAVARGILFQRRIGSTYPRGTPRIRELGGATAFGRRVAEARAETTASDST